MSRRETVNNLREHLKWLATSKANIPPKREEGPIASRTTTTTTATPQQQQRQRPTEEAIVHIRAVPQPPDRGKGVGGGGGGVGTQQLTGSTLVVSGQDRVGITREDSNPNATVAVQVRNNSFGGSSTSNNAVPSRGTTSKGAINNAEEEPQQQRTFATPALPQRLNSTAGSSVTRPQKNTKLNSSAPAKTTIPNPLPSTTPDRPEDTEMQLRLDDEPSAKPGLASSRKPAKKSTDNPQAPSSPTSKNAENNARLNSLVNAYKEQVTTLGNIDPNHSLRTPQPGRNAPQLTNFATTSRKLKRLPIPPERVESIDLTADSDDALSPSESGTGPGSSTTSMGASGREDTSAHAALPSEQSADSEPVRPSKRTKPTKSSKASKSKSDKSRSATAEPVSQSGSANEEEGSDAVATNPKERKKRKKEKEKTSNGSKSGSKTEERLKAVDNTPITISSANTGEVNRTYIPDDEQPQPTFASKSSNASAVGSTKNSPVQKPREERGVIPCSDDEEELMLDDVGQTEVHAHAISTEMNLDAEVLADLPKSSDEVASSLVEKLKKETPTASPLQIHSPTKLPATATESSFPPPFSRSALTSSAPAQVVKSSSKDGDHDAIPFPLSAPDAEDENPDGGRKGSTPLNNMDDKSDYQRLMEMGLLDLKSLEQKLQQQLNNHVYEMIRKLKSGATNANFAELGRQKDDYDRQLMLVSQVAKRKGTDLVRINGSQSTSDLKAVVSQRVVVEATQYLVQNTPLNNVRLPSPPPHAVQSDSTQNFVKQTQFPGSMVPATPQKQSRQPGHGHFFEDTIKESPLGGGAEGGRDRDGDFLMDISSPAQRDNFINGRGRPAMIAESSPMQEKTPSPSPQEQRRVLNKGKAPAVANYIDDMAGCEGFGSDFDGEVSEEEEEDEDDIPLATARARRTAAAAHVSPEEEAGFEDEGTDDEYGDADMDANLKDYELGVIREEGDEAMENHGFINDEGEDEDEDDDDLQIMDEAPQVFRKRCEEQAMSQVIKAPILEKPQQIDMTSKEMSRPWSKEVAKSLREKFKLHGFRSNQLEAINSILSGQDTFVLMPTGGGKSLCYQLPAVVQTGNTKGVTFVISPLLSLMHDQTMQLQKLNIQALMFNSETKKDIKDIIMEALFDNRPEEKIQLLYVTPEMVNNSQRMRQAMARLHSRGKLARICIDEAHCVSQWGHDFRPDYTELGKIRDLFQGVPIIALTATANSRVQSDILFNLRMKNPARFSQSFNRPNLSYEVLPKAPKQGVINDIATLINKNYKNKSGIVYCLARYTCEDVAKELRARGVRAQHYHAGMKPDEKTGAQKNWIDGRFKVIVATIAFGMGIDKPDVRFVIHHSMPKSLEGYYQETGRAGRDGQHSGCYLYFGRGDIKSLTNLIENGDGATAQTIALQKQSLQQVVDYCNNKQDCRRKQVLQYFDEKFDPVNCNKTCDNCLSDHEYTDRDITKEAKELAELVRELQVMENNNVTLPGLVEIYKGSKNKKITEAGHHTLPNHGGGKHWQKSDITRLIETLISENILQQAPVQNRMGFTNMYMRIGKDARSVLKGNASVSFKVLQSPTSGRTLANATENRPAGKRGTRDSAADSTQPFLSTNVSSPVAQPPRARPRAAANKSQAREAYEGSQPDLPDSLGFNPVREAGRKRKSDGGSEISGKRQKKTASKPITEKADRVLSNLNEYEKEMLVRFMKDAKAIREELCNDKALRVESVFTDHELRHMFLHLPTNLAAMKQVQDLDPERVDRHGRKFIRICQQYYNEKEDNYEGAEQSQFQSQSASAAAAATADNSVINVEDEDDGDEDEDEYGDDDDFDDIDPDAISASHKENQMPYDDDDYEDIDGQTSKFFSNGPSQDVQDFNQRLHAATLQGDDDTASTSNKYDKSGRSGKFSRASKSGSTGGRKKYTKRSGFSRGGSRGSKARGGFAAGGGSRGKSTTSKSQGASTSRKSTNSSARGRGGASSSAKSGNVKSAASTAMFTLFQ